MPSKSAFLRRIMVLLLALGLTAGCGDSVENFVFTGTNSTDASLVQLQITPTNPTLTAGGTLQLTVSGDYSNARTLDLTGLSTFTSSNPAVATVSSTGVVTGVSAGNATVTANVNGANVSTTVTVNQAGPVAPNLNAYSIDAANGNLVHFNTSTPATVTSVPMTGLTAGDTIVGIDFRPQNEFLYGLGFNPTTGDLTIYNIGIDTDSGTLVGAHATAVGPAVDFAFSAGTEFGFDFNPTVDRIRVIASSGENLRFNPNTGALAGTDTALNGGASVSSGSAYTNSVQNATVTTLFALDDASNSLYLQSNPNGGLLTDGRAVSVNGATLDFTAVNGFDIPADVATTTSNQAPAAGSAVALLRVGATTSVYTISLQNGTAINFGAVGNGATTLRGLALANNIAGEPAVGLSQDGVVRFSTATPGTQVATPITGVTAGEVLMGIDWRPATGQLFAMGLNQAAENASLYVLDPQTGAATLVGGASGSIAFVDTVGNQVAFPDVDGIGFDFNPTVDRIRLVAGTLNARLNPLTGGPVDGDAANAGIQPDGTVNGATTNLTGAAYTNSYGQPLTGGVTTLYTLDEISNSLFIQNPPNPGTQVLVNPLTLGGQPLDFSAINGFAIQSSVAVAVSNTAAPANSLAFATLQVGGVIGLYTINLTTGAATSLGTVGTVYSLAIGG